jgi:archaellum component FlaC
MREVSQIEVYEVLKEKVGEEAAKILIEYIELKKKEVATKEDIMRLEQSTKEDIMRLEQSTKEDIMRLERSTKEDIMRLEQSTKEDIQRLEEIVKMVEKSTREEIRRLEKRVEKVENDINDLKKEQRRNLYWILGVYITLWATTIAGIITLLLRIKP